MGWVVNATCRPLYPRESKTIPILYEAGWAPGPVWTCGENLAPTRIRSPDSPACSKSLYRLNYHESRSVKRFWSSNGGRTDEQTDSTMSFFSFTKISGSKSEMRIPPRRNWSLYSSAMLRKGCWWFVDVSPPTGWPETALEQLKSLA
jgi:hypothetical protein